MTNGNLFQLIPMVNKFYIIASIEEILCEGFSRFYAHPRPFFLPPGSPTTTEIIFPFNLLLTFLFYDTIIIPTIE